jgi:hypothetical protein
MLTSLVSPSGLDVTPRGRVSPKPWIRSRFGLAPGVHYHPASGTLHENRKAFTQTKEEQP